MSARAATEALMIGATGGAAIPFVLGKRLYDEKGSRKKKVYVAEPENEEAARQRAVARLSVQPGGRNTNLLTGPAGLGGKQTLLGGTR